MSVREHASRKWMAFLTITTALIVSAIGISAVEVVEYRQGFEESTDGWFDSTSDEPWRGIIERVPSGMQGVDSPVGAFHATVENDGTNPDGPFSRFGGYSDEWPTEGYVTELLVYLDPEWDLGTGFEHTVAANGSNNEHLRDYVFHVTKDTSENVLLLGVSNNSDLSPKETIEDGDHFNFAEEGQTAGWYKLRHRFWDDEGLHRVDLSLLDSNGSELFIETLPPVDHPIQDPIEEVGGNRYAWFTVISEGITLHIDDQRLCLGSECTDPPPPTTSSTTTTTTTQPPTMTTTTTTQPTTTTTQPTTTTTTTPPPPTTQPEPHPGFGDVPDDHMFADDIQWLADEGITVGCNPPDNTLFCPSEPVTRGEMAAFINRALNLPETTDDHFVDDDDSVFEDDINRVAGSGITVGCNPPDNDEFCPTHNMLRREMASFLTRAYGFVDDDPDSDRFVDDDDTVHEPDIEALAASGVTVGCNPPANTMFCPDEDVLREQMAAFLHRAETP